MFEHVIRTPFDMKPVFTQCERPKFNANNTDLEIQNLKKLELDNLGPDIWFETDVAKDEKLAEELETKFAWYPVHPKEDLASIMYRSGQQEVVQYIKSILNE